MPSSLILSDLDCSNWTISPLPKPSVLTMSAASTSGGVVTTIWVGPVTTRRASTGALTKMSAVSPLTMMTGSDRHHPTPALAVEADRAIRTVINVSAHRTDG